MSRAAPEREWWTAEELASSSLPDMPTTKRRVNAMADRDGWRGHPKFARPRTGRGGGWEYHWKLLPARAQADLLKRSGVVDGAGEPSERMTRDEAWLWFDGLPEAVKVKARQRLKIIGQVEELEFALGKFTAVNQIARSSDTSARTIWNWFAMVEGIDTADRLAYLAPRHRNVAKPEGKTEAAPEFFEWLKADFLRLEAPSFAAAYDTAVKLCNAKGLTVLTSRTARRWMDRTVPHVTQVFAREGLRGLERCFPPQKRDRTGMVALEGVNADCHKIDVFVQWPGLDKPMRPQVVAFQDLYSGKILAWRVDRDPNKVAVMSAFGELVETWGIPKHCLFDNGREFANKWLTGGTATRFRFKIREDDPLGVLPQMGITSHWATPGHGQAKPIERGFRDFAQRIAKDARFEGAYVGNRPDAKPENYMSRAVPLKEFMPILEQGIADHNARQGRLSPTTMGRSFDETFADSYATAPIRKATPEQRRLWLMAQETRQLHRGHGMLTLHEGEYWSDWMSQHAGQKVIARFDPEDLHAGLYIYSLDGEFMGFAECRVKAPFFDLASAEALSKDKARRRKEQRQLLKSIQSTSVGQLASDLNSLPRTEAAPLEAKIVQLAQLTRGPLIDRPMPAPETSGEDDEKHSAFVLEFQRSATTTAKSEPKEGPKERFLRALSIEQRAEAGEPVGTSEAEWLMNYQQQPEYTRQRMLWEDFGDAALG